MGKKAAIAAAVVLTALLGVLIWRLDIPNWKKLDPSLILSQPAVTVVSDAEGNAIRSSLSPRNQTRTPLNEIPETVRNAFLAAEDHRFYSHHGVSLRRIAGAFLANLRSGGYSQGASTITQQLIKLTHLSPEKTLSRKAQEAVLAMQLERVLSKDEILEAYLNTVYFGKGAYGISAAAETYFGKTPAGLTAAEAALLAGIIKSPSAYAPHLDAEKSLQRRNAVLSSMEKYGFLSPSQAQAAKAEPLNLSIDEDDSEPYGWYVDAAMDEAAGLLSMTVDELLISGYTIHTAFDPALQDAADTLFSDDTLFPPSATDGTPVQAAMVVMEPETGAVRALIGGRKYEVLRGLNRAVQIRRSPGSAIKPVSVYAAAIDAFGFSPTSLVEDTPREFDGGYTPRNAGGSSSGTVTLREALSRSLNIAAVDLADLIGVRAVRDYAVRFGLQPDRQDQNLSLALGSMTHGVSPAELCAAYAALSNGGTRVSAHLVEKITAADGRILYEAEPSEVRAVRDSTACMITDMLKTAASSGSARALASADIPVAAKTGTVSDSDGSTRDVWTAAYTPDLVVTVWMGFDNPGEGRRMSSSEGGSGYPARLCAAFLKSVSDRLEKRDFAVPASVREVLLDGLALEKHLVRLADAETPGDYIVTDLFREGELPQEYTAEWSAPDSVSDLTLLSRSGETPVLQFTALSENAEYLVLRTCEGETDVAAVLTGQPGETLRYADTQADLTRRAQYTILPRHRLLYERGRLLTGKESAAVTYSPGGILDWLLPSGAEESAPEQAELEISESESIFG